MNRIKKGAIKMPITQTEMEHYQAKRRHKDTILRREGERHRREYLIGLVESIWDDSEESEGAIGEELMKKFDKGELKFIDEDKDYLIRLCATMIFDCRGNEHLQHLFLVFREHLLGLYSRILEAYILGNHDT